MKLKAILKALSTYKKGGWVLVLTLIIFQCTPVEKHQYDSDFKYHIPITPQTFDPILQRGTTSGFLLNHLYLPLLSVNDKNQVAFNAAENCYWKKAQAQYICQLRSGLKFEDGTNITAQNFMHSFELIFEQSSEASGLFLHLKHQNLSDITMPQPDVLAFQFRDYLPQEALLLTRLEFSPRKEKQFYKTPQDILASGPYKVKAHKKNQFLSLTSNTINDQALSLPTQRPDVTVFFIEDESTALRLYESNKLDFIKNVPRSHFKKYKDQMHFQTMMRMDGMAFSGKAFKNSDFKKALIYALKYEELQKLYESKGVPGCPALPQSFYTNKHCYKFDLKQAKKHWKKVPEHLKNKLWILNFSEVGGEDIRKGMEWMAYQWQKHLDLKIRIEPLEVGQFLEKIRTKKFDIIRKGVPLSTPSCFEALKTFSKYSNNNFSSIHNSKLDQWVYKMGQIQTSQTSKLKDHCDQGLALLYQEFSFIPLGEMYFAFLNNGRFTGWSVNSLNILNLEHLKLKN